MEKTIFFLNNSYTIESFSNPLLLVSGVVILLHKADDMQRIVDYVNDIKIPEPNDIEGNKEFDRVITNCIVDKLY